jgi:hypothetical protein
MPSCAPLLVCEKHVPIEIVLRDQSVSELYILDKIERQASHQLLRAIVTQLEGLFPDPIRRSRLADTVRVGRLVNPDERRSRDAVGLPVIVNDSAGTSVPVFPPDFDLRSYLTVNNTIDRGSTGAALMAFVMTHGYLWTVYWGFFHDLWNSIKNAAKHVGGFWNYLVKFSSICNINHGPFRSGAWGKTKQSAHKSYMDKTTVNTESFREAARKTAALLGKACVTEDDYAYWYRYASRLPSCVAAGPVCKFARWMSIEECWLYYRSEMWFLKEVFQHMNPDEAQRLVQAASTQLLDAELAEHMTSRWTYQARTEIHHARAHRYFGYFQCDDRSTPTYI